MGWLADFALKLLTKLGLLFLIRKGAKDDARADSAEQALETISKANAPFSDPDLQRVREKWRRD